MPAPPEKALRTVEDFVDFVRGLDEAGIEFAVIGGCAVGAYARLRGESVFSADLDIYVRETTLPELLTWAEANGAAVVSRPQPRAVPVAVLTWRGEEVNVLTSSSGLPPPDAVLRAAREFELHGTGLRILIADPLDVLANKLAIRRDKDLPHIELLRRFVYDEVVRAFGEQERPRDALEPLRRLLSVLDRDVLPDELERPLVALASDPVRRRFLVHRLATRAAAEEVLAAAASVDEKAELEKILAKRGLAPE